MDALESPATESPKSAESPRTAEQRALPQSNGYDPQPAPGIHGPGAKRRWWLWLLVVGALGINAYAVLSGHTAATSPTPAAAAQSARHGPTPPVTVELAKTGTLNHYVTAIGTVTAFNTVTVQSRISGQIVQVAFKEGQRVRKGDLLVMIDPRPYKIAVDQMAGVLRKDQAALKDGQITLVRDRELVEKGVMDQQDMDKGTQILGQDEGTVQSDVANLNNAKLNLFYCRITAPINGRIGLRLVDVGNYIQSTSTSGIAVITQLQPIAVDFSIPEDDLPPVVTAMQGGQKLAVQAWDRGLKNLMATGTLETFDSQIDQTTGTIKLKAIFQNNNTSLFPNQFVNAKLLISAENNVVLAPAAAVQRSGQTNYVYVVKPNQTVESRPVTLGGTQGGMIALVSGVTSGETLVVDGVNGLQTGSKVTVQMAQAETATPPTAPTAAQSTNSQIGSDPDPQSATSPALSGGGQPQLQ